MIVSIGSALLIAVVRLLHRQTIRHAVNGVFGVAIGVALPGRPAARASTPCWGPPDRGGAAHALANTTTTIAVAPACADDLAACDGSGRSPIAVYRVQIAGWFACSAG